MRSTKSLTILNLAALILLAFIISSCSSFFDKDNTPEPKALVNFSQTLNPNRIWSAKTGKGAGNDYLKMGAKLSGDNIFTASHDGVVSSYNKNTGKLNWQFASDLPLTTTPAVAEQTVIVMSHKGEVLALSELTGKERWRVNLTNVVLAAPAIAQNKVVIKTISGEVKALSLTDGALVWSYEQTEPDFILRGSSAPRIHGNSVFVGFANGHLVKLALNDGTLLFDQTIAIPQGAFAVQRMIDIDLDPVIQGNQLFIASYQGNLICLNTETGQTIWSHPVSSYIGMISDGNTLYLSDAKNNLFAYNQTNGAQKWQQTNLEARHISGPALLGNYLIVGDAQGYLHWMNKQTGEFVARDYLDSSGVYAAPVTSENRLYVLTNNGELIAYQL